MFKPRVSPICTPSSQSHHLADEDTETFSLLCWNLHKHTPAQHYPPQLAKALFTSDLLCLQEVPLTDKQLWNRPYAASPNLQTRQNQYGVATASKSGAKLHTQYLSHHRELGLLTHKSALVTQHPLCENRTLTVVNVHAINFVPNAIFKRELQHIIQLIDAIHTPLILCGDFNTWNRRRLYLLKHLTEQRQLSAVEFENPTAIKSLLNHPLDHIFYRGLSLTEAKVLNGIAFSDHNPLLTRFQLPKNI